MPRIQSRSTLGDLGTRGLGPEFEDVFDQNIVKFTGRENVRRVVDFKTTDKAKLRTTGLTGYKFLQEFEEGSPIPQDSNIKTFETAFSIRDYGLSSVVTDNMKEDQERLGQKLDEFANHSKAADITFHKGGMMMFNGGFGTTAKIQGFSLHRYNDEQLFTTSHARADGGSAQSNRSSTNIVLTELNLETQRLLLVKQLTDNGMPMNDVGRINLVVPDDLERNATIFVASSLRPSTANNDINFYRGIQMDVLSSRWLNSDSGGSATQWFLATSFMGVNPLRVYDRGAPRFKQTFDGNTWNQTFSVKHRYAIGNIDWRGLVGSDGSGS